MRTIVFCTFCLAAGLLAAQETRDRQTRALDSPQRNPKQEARDAAKAQSEVAAPLDEFVLTVPGRAATSSANFIKGELVVRDALGREWVYTRAKQYDTADGDFLGYYSASADRYVLWPASGKGNLHVGSVLEGDRVTFRPSTMIVRRTPRPAAGVEPPRDVEIVTPDAPPRPDTPPLPEGESAAIPLEDSRVSLPGAYYIPGEKGGVAYITRDREAKGYTLTDPTGTSGPVDWMPKGGAVVIDRAGGKMKGTATQEVLSFDKSTWHRIALLGVYFDLAEQPHEIVIADGRINVRSVNEAGDVSLEPLAVLSAIEVTSPARGKAKLRNGRLTWGDSGDEWIGPIWLQGNWDHGGKLCEIEQDGQTLTMINENGQVSSARILNSRTLMAKDWNAPATINVRQSVISFEDGEKWTRFATEDFPVAEKTTSPPPRR